MTSAPSAPSILVAIGPAITQLKSTTRTPASGIFGTTRRRSTTFGVASGARSRCAMLPSPGVLTSTPRGSLPDIGGLDETRHGEFRKGQYRCSQQDVVANLEAAGGIDWQRTFLIPGYFERSLTPQAIYRHDIRRGRCCDDRLRSVLLDRRRGLNFLASLIGEGTVLIMDDWNCFDANDDKGQRRAMHEYLEVRRHFAPFEPLIAYGPNSQSFVVRSATHH